MGFNLSLNWICSRKLW